MSKHNHIQLYNNVKSQIKDNVSQGLRSLSQKISDKLSPTLGNIVRPLTDDLPQEYARNNLDETFDGSNQNRSIFDEPSRGASTELGSKSPSDTLGKETIKESSTSKTSAQTTTTDRQQVTQTAESTKVEAAAPAAKQALYAIRVRRFVERESALKLAEELDRKGYNSYVIPLWNKDGHLDFEVRSGAYTTYAQVQDAVKVLQ
ncbi:MAG: SPOR domain-containing protein [Janthinobacterium lividum]